jgi:ABC-type multidrug transport system permease subunit
MIAGSAGKDFIGTLFYGMVFMIPLIVPAFAALFPGTASPWVRALPSYPLIEGLVETTIYGQGWAESWGRIGVLAAWCAVVFGVGWVVLRRRVVRG